MTAPRGAAAGPRGAAAGPRDAAAGPRDAAAGPRDAAAGRTDAAAGPRDQALPRTAELVIVGAGVIGAATAFAARRAGLDPLVLEARAAPAAATTAAATGAYRLQQDDPDELAIMRETVAALYDFADFTGQTAHDPRPQPNGLMSVTTTQAGAREQLETVAHQRSIGVDGIEVLDGDEARDRFPYLSETVRQVRIRMQDGLLDQRELALGLLEGARVRLSTRVTGFDTRGGLTAVHTDRGTVSTRACVIATGPLSGKVAALAGIELPIHVLLRHKLLIPQLPQVPQWAPLTFDEDTGGHWRPTGEGAALLISVYGQQPGEAVEDPVPEPDFAERVLRSVARITPFWRDIAPDPNWPVKCGFYTVTPDHRPLIDATPVDGLYVNTGYSGHGVMSSIGGARHLLDVMTASNQHNPFALDRTFVPPRGKTR
ncbi:NAD(P)/FAD-dependent oxidoreductase [Solirubrobacter soli]|uniref:NAD(P)/FAD-dependent oxidoreductase n=1 Tax=Solirubrobacter soli TaxID=363832 RepID=UPI0004035839|nr:FAD-binding oxidoreductase [Solirubrobacter soli]